MTDRIESFESDLATELVERGIADRLLRLESLKTGANNRVFRALTERGSLLVKQYFQHEHDDRDRLHTEFNFLSFAHGISSRYLPKPLVLLATLNTAIYEYVEGQPVSAADVDAEAVAAAAGFFAALNAPEYRRNSLQLPTASDAAFSINGHLQRVEQRLQALQQAAGQSANHDFKLLLVQLVDTWHQIRCATVEACSENGTHLEAELSARQRCLSPSDFGFHNALNTGEGGYRFVDFEYAGIDDPAKMVADFFIQPAVPVPIQYYEAFVGQALEPFDDKADIERRARLLRPVFLVKWCCILLNVFLPVHLERRQFSHGTLGVEELQQTQLQKAVVLLEEISALPSIKLSD